MPLPERREFLQTAAAGAAALAFARPPPPARAARSSSASSAPAAWGSNHVSSPGQAARTSRSPTSATSTRTGSPPRPRRSRRPSKRRRRPSSDMRKVLDDKAVDAVFIATPDHWHAPAAILALDAGKHVYVEKPCCHNIREGRLMVEAVKRSGKLLQVGTQSRSSAAFSEAMQRLQRRRDRRRAGRQGLEQPAPRHHRQGEARASRRRNLDYDLWFGPAPMVPYQSNLLPGIWRWWYDFGCGDIGNDGVHDIDVAVWGLGVDDAPVASDLPGRQVLLRRRPAVPRHAVRRLRVPGRGQAGQTQAAHLRAAHLVAVRAGGLRERRRVLRHQGDADHRPLGRLEAVRPAEQADRREDAAEPTWPPTTPTSSTASAASQTQLNADVDGRPPVGDASCTWPTSPPGPERC